MSVRAGPVWWTLHPGGEATTNEGDPALGLGMEPEFGLLHPRSLLAVTTLQVLRESKVAGRRAVILRATPRPAANEGRWWGFCDSTEPIEVPIDLERGVALRGYGFRVDEIYFDEELAPEVFSRPYPDTHQPVDRGLRPRAVTLEEARHTATFPLMIPEWLPEGARFLRCRADPAEPPEWIGFSWAIDPGHRFTLYLRQGPSVVRATEGFRGEEVVKDGLRLLIQEIGPPNHRSLTVFVQTRAAWCEFHSELPLDTIVAVARSLKDQA